MKIMGYMGYRRDGVAIVTRHFLDENNDPKSELLDNYIDKIKHSTDFEWGYYGSGPSQLSFCILFDFTEDYSFTSKHYQDFKILYIGKFKDSWMITKEEIKSFMLDRIVEE